MLQKSPQLSLTGIFASYAKNLQMNLQMNTSSEGYWEWYDTISENLKEFSRHGDNTPAISTYIKHLEC